MQGAVDAILTPIGIKRRVFSRGVKFKNRDAWTAEAFTHMLCEWLSASPSRVPSGSDLRHIISQANSVRVRDPHIQVARMPERVTHAVALAIIGGGYHEAWHTKYSKRDRVLLEEVEPIENIRRLSTSMKKAT